MKRRTFLKLSSVLGAGITILSPHTLFAHRTLHTISIGEMNYELRHGNLFSNTVETVEHSVLCAVSRTRFYKNGFAPSDEDLVKLDITDQHQHTYSFISDHTKVVSLGKAAPDYIHAISAQTTVAHAGLFIPMHEEVSINGSKTASNKAIYVSPKDRFDRPVTGILVMR